jgi:secondary thiamine-phosphate synthase enzyme
VKRSDSSAALACHSTHKSHSCAIVRVLITTWSFEWLEGLAPFDTSPTRYKHNRTGEDNADAHMKRQVMGREVVVAITKGKLDFGPWEQIFYGEFDGRRPKRVLVKVIGE